MTAPTLDLSFPHHWQAEILAARPLILPPRHFVYPREAEEVERGALEILLRPIMPEKPSAAEVPGVPLVRQHGNPSLPQPGSGARAITELVERRAPGQYSAEAEPFLATCALGFRASGVPTGVWSAPRAEEVCAVSGGYAYLIDTTAPERFTMLPYRPVLEVRPLAEQGLLLFVGHHGILAWGAEGQAWQSDKLSSEGVNITKIEDCLLHGLGWDLMTDKETPFVLDLRTGLRTG